MRGQKATFKFVNLSSSGQSDEESDKENIQSQSQITTQTYSKASHQPCTHQGNIAHKQSSIINQVKSNINQKELQFSTLSLKDSSIDDSIYQNQAIEKAILKKQNEELKKVNLELDHELRKLLEQRTNLEQRVITSEQIIEKLKTQATSLRSRLSKSESAYSNSIKQYQNKLLNYELPGNRHWTEQADRISSQIKEQIKNISAKYIKELSQQRMNFKVQEIITNMVKEFLQITPRHHSNSEISNKFKSNKSQAYTSKRMKQLIEEPNQNASFVSEDYRMLSKSIQKLKNMGKEIDKKSASYLKSRHEQDNTSFNRSIGLDHSSIGDLGRSKSRRKRIFQ